jgi:hypothetical protein
MARPGNEVLNGPSKDPEEAESDYGSDFSPEEEELINKLISLSPTVVEGRTHNPIINHAKCNSDAQNNQVSRVLTREEPSPTCNTAEQKSIPAVKTGDASFTKCKTHCIRCTHPTLIDPSVQQTS